MQANIWFKITELPLVIDFRMYCYLFLSFILQFLVFYFIRLTQASQNNYQLGIRLSIAQLCLLESFNIENQLIQTFFAIFGLNLRVTLSINS